MKRKDGHVLLGLTVFFTVSAILLLYDTFFGSRVLQSFSRQFLSALSPVLYGAFMAYLLAPMVNYFEELFLPKGKKLEKGKRTSGGLRALSILLTWAIIVVMLYLLASVLLPELYKSIAQLLSNIETYYHTISGWVAQLLETYPPLEHWVSQQLDLSYNSLMNWITKEVLPQASTLMTIVSGSVFGLVSFVSDLLVGIIVSIYFLATKETCAAHARKVVCSLFPKEHVYWVLRGAAKVDSIFAGFVRGKLLDSIIIGVMCFVGCSILKFPYTPLVSVIVGVTNVIPFFGPFLGAIPSTFLILLVSPMKALYFVLFVLLLQQLDGNIIGPKILGDKTGLSSLWVIIAILVGGSFFGLAGMFFGVPVCACLYSAADFLVRVLLKKKGLPLATEAYAAGTPEGTGEAPEEDPAETDEETP